MTKEDRYSLIGALFCGGVAYFDAGWRPFWIGCGILLAGWTVVSLWRRIRAN